MKILNVHAEEEIGEIGGERDGKRVRESDGTEHIDMHGWGRWEKI